MSKKRIHIDELFRRGLGNMQLPVSGSDWGDMQAMIAAAQKRRKRIVLWWWFTGLFLVLGTGALITYNYSNNAAKSAVATSVTSSSTQPLQNKPNTSEGVNQNITSPQQNKTATQNNTGDNTQLGGEKSINPKSVNTASKKSPNKTPEQPKQSSKLQKNNSDKTLGEGTPETQLPQKDIDGEKTKDVEDTNSTNNNPEIPVAPAIADNAEKADSTPTPNTPPPTKPSKGDKGSKPRKTGFSGISLSAGPAINTFGISNATNYGRIRNAGDKLGIGVGALIAGDYEWKKFTFTGGIGFNSIGGGGRYNYKRQIWDSVPVLGPGGIVGYFYKNFRDTSLNYTINNRFNYLTLPIQASYMIYEGKKSGFLVGMGLQVQYLLNAQGEYINPYNLFKFDLSKTPGFVKKWNVGGNIRLGYYYDISDNFTLNIAFNYTQSNRMLNKDIDVAIKPRSIGLEMGIKYNLVKK